MNCGPKKTYAFFPEYTSIAQNYYDAGTLNLDFINQPEDSRKTINTWVEDKTNNQIKDLLSGGSITHDTKLVITNCNLLQRHIGSGNSQSRIRKRTRFT